MTSRENDLLEDFTNPVEDISLKQLDNSRKRDGSFYKKKSGLPQFGNSFQYGSSSQ